MTPYSSIVYLLYQLDLISAKTTFTIIPKQSPFKNYANLVKKQDFINAEDQLRRAK